MDTEYLIKEKKLSIILGKNRSTLRAWRNNGKIPYLKIGTKTIRYKLSDVLKALNE
tara:strand:- start:182 stop:349 length:168 start_codon:yes stop_codon:yes gene_type:complete